MIICAPGGERSSPGFRFKFGSSGHFGTQMSASGAPSNPAVQFQILSTRLSVTRRHHARVSAMLSKFERYPLTFGPTPIEKLSRLTAHLGGDVEIFAKREDCNSGLAFGPLRLESPPRPWGDGGGVGKDGARQAGLGVAPRTHTKIESRR
jgi:hypothetical protein